MVAIQKDINATMRGILVDWLVDVVDEFKLLADTLYLAVSYIDRFLTASVITRDKLQLLGVASLFVAAYGPKLSSISFVPLFVISYHDWPTYNGLNLML